MSKSDGNDVSVTIKSDGKWRMSRVSLTKMTYVMSQSDGIDGCHEQV